MRMFVSALPLLIFVSHTALAAVDGTLLSIAPSASTVLAGIDIRRAALSLSGQHIVNQVMTDRSATALVRLTGLDVRRDLRQVLLVGLGRQSSFDAPNAVLAHGNFDASRIIAAARVRGVSIKQYQGGTLIVQNTGTAVMAIGFPGPGLLVAGDLTTVENVLASAVEARAIDPGLREQVNQIGPPNDFWYATILSGSFLATQIQGSLPPPLRNSSALTGITRSSGGLQFGQPDRVTLNLVGRSIGEAQLLSALLRVAASLASLQPQVDATFMLAETALSSMQISVEGPTVQAISTVPDPQLERTLASGN